MTIDKAIEILAKAKEHDFPHSVKGYEEASQLGIEALKRINNPLQYNLTNPRVLLPGETE